MRYLVSFSTNPQFGIFGAFGRRHDPHGVKVILYFLYSPVFQAHILCFRGKEKIPIFCINSPVFPVFIELSPIFLELCIPVSKQQLPQQFQIKFLLLRSISDHNIACLVFNFIANQYFPSCLMIHSCNTGSYGS